jgi:hypothetical protein
LAIDLLRITFTSLLTDTEELTSKLETRAGELEFLKRVGERSRLKIQYPLVNEFTVRVLAFIRLLITQLGKVSFPVLLSLTLCVRALLDRHQLHANYRPILAVLGILIDAHQEEICGAHNRVLDEIVSLVFDLTTRQLQTAKAAGFAILVHLLFTEWATTGTLLLTGCQMDQQFIDHLWTLPRYKVEALKGAFDGILPFVRNFVQTEFVKAVEVLVHRFGVISNCIGDKTLPVTFENQPQVMQLLATLPFQLVHYLSLLVQECARARMPSMFNVQLNLVSVIWWTLREAGVEDAYKFDLGGIFPSKSVDLSGYSKRELKYFFDSADISVQSLIDAIRGAIASGESAGFAEQSAVLKQILSIVE